MDGHQPDAVDVVAVDRFAAEVSVPGVEHILDADRLAVYQRRHLVKKGTDISTLVVETLQTKDGIEVLKEHHQRFSPQLVTLRT